MVESKNTFNQVIIQTKNTAANSHTDTCKTYNALLFMSGVKKSETTLQRHRSIYNHHIA